MKKKIKKIMWLVVKKTGKKNISKEDIFDTKKDAIYDENFFPEEDKIIKIQIKEV